MLSLNPRGDFDVQVIFVHRSSVRKNQISSERIRDNYPLIIRSRTRPLTEVHLTTVSQEFLESRVNLGKNAVPSTDLRLFPIFKSFRGQVLSTTN